MNKWNAAAGSCEQCSDPLGLQIREMFILAVQILALEGDWFYYVKINNLDLKNIRDSYGYVLRKDKFRCFLFFSHYVNPLKDMTLTQNCICS
jgi:hypothetical protein